MKTLAISNEGKIVLPKMGIMTHLVELTRYDYIYICSWCIYSCLLLLGSWSLARGWELVLGCWFLVLGLWFSVLGCRGTHGDK